MPRVAVHTHTHTHAARTYIHIYDHPSSYRHGNTSICGPVYLYVTKQTFHHSPSTTPCTYTLDATWHYRSKNDGTLHLYIWCTCCTYVSEFVCVPVSLRFSLSLSLCVFTCRITDAHFLNRHKQAPDQPLQSSTGGEVRAKSSFPPDSRTAARLLGGSVCFCTVLYGLRHSAVCRTRVFLRRTPCPATCNETTPLDRRCVCAGPTGSLGHDL